MGLDIFAKIPGILGESLDASHKDEIEVLSFSWGVTNSGSPPGTALSGVGGVAGKASFHDLTFVHKIDKASPLLVQACADGRHIQEATITYRNAQQQDYLVVKLNDVSITDVTAGATSAQAGSETVSLAFARMDLQYMPQKADGSLDTGIHFNYDLGANTTGVPLGPLAGRAMRVPPG
jgi:type VI secretion system secreted protein Hcp